MDKTMKEKIRYFSSYTDDFVTSKNQSFTLPDGYEWIRRGAAARILSALVYAVAVVAGSVYLFLVLHLRYKGKKKMRGALIFGNHTQPVGDIFIPALASLPTRIYVVASPANYGIPVAGKILPYLGALPTASTLPQLKKLTEAIGEHLKSGKNVVIYPEAHVWQYYTGIRPYPESAFKFAVKFNVPVYCTTVTYQKCRFTKRPKTTVHVDGPFYPDTSLRETEQAKKLRDEVHSRMLDRSKNSTYEYIKYIKRDA